MSTDLRILAHAQVPSEGEWTIPGLRPLDATWTGGPTTVFLDEFHVMKECREKAGRLVFPTSPDSGPVDRLEFESGSPGSVADLVFHSARADTSCAVRGRLFVAGSPARLECELSWAVHEGSMPELAIDLSPAWLPDRVVVRGMDDPVAWHPSLLPSGSTRVHVALPVATNMPKELVVVVTASSTASGGRGPLQLPRVRPVGARLIDEAWVAWVEQGTMIQPTMARGLAWIDPSEVPGLVAPRPVGSDLREALAWRWIAEKADARVDRRAHRTGARRFDSRPCADRLRRPPSHARRPNLVFMRAPARSSSVPLWNSQSDRLLEPWRFRDLARRGYSRPSRSTNPTAPGSGSPRKGRLAASSSTYPIRPKKPFEFHAEYSWNKHGLIPLVSVPREYLPRGMVVFEAPATVHARLKTVGLRRLAAAALEPDRGQSGERHRESRAVRRRRRQKTRMVDAFAYTEPGGRLELFTEPLTASEPPGFVREALLTTVRRSPGDACEPSAYASQSRRNAVT